MPKLKLIVVLLCCLSACVRIPASSGASPEVVGHKRQNVDLGWYEPQGGYLDWSLYSVTPAQSYTVRRYVLKSNYGHIVLDYFDIREQQNDELVVVFPILGGKNKISNYFSDALAKSGFESVIIHRSDTFKDVAIFSRIEQTLRENVIRDRIALNFMEDELAKHAFAGFGMSRGGMNLVLTAGVDPRLQHNVIALAGDDLHDVLKASEEWRIRSHFSKLATLRNETEEEVFQFLKSELVTQPFEFAHKLDPEKTLLILGYLDSTVPFRYGWQLRNQLGEPETLVFLSGHATTLLYSQFFRVPLPGTREALFPVPYIESEVAAFFSSSFNRGEPWWHRLYRVIQTPASLFISALL